MIKTLRRTHAPRIIQPARVRTGWYGGVHWQRLTKAWLQRYPVCILCLVRGEINRGANDEAITRQRNLIVDHIEPHRGERTLFFDNSNLETLCRCPCHDVDKQRHEQQGRTGQQWLEHLRDEMVRTGSEDVVRELWGLVPEIARQVVGYTPPPPQGRGGAVLATRRTVPEWTRGRSFAGILS